MAGKDFYKTLGLGRNATEKEIKQAYRRLARQYHPDINPGDKSAEGRFKEINEAFEVLSDPSKRQKYDRYGDQWQYADQFAKAGEGAKQNFGKGGSTYTTFDFSDLSDMGGIFEGIFGGSTAGTHTSRRAAKPKSMEHAVEVTLEEAYHGTKRILEMAIDEPCATCGGTGASKDRIRGKPCPTCNGAAWIRRPKRLEVKIPPGVNEGSKIRIAGEGAATSSGTKGDIYLLVKIAPHNLFERKGDDIHVDVSAPLVTLMLGGEVQVPTLKGKLALKIPPETQNGKVFRLAGQGMPHLGDSSQGDLFARIEAVLPTNLTSQERQLFQQLKVTRPG